MRGRREDGTVVFQYTRLWALCLPSIFGPTAGPEGRDTTYVTVGQLTQVTVPWHQQ